MEIDEPESSESKSRKRSEKRRRVVAEIRGLQDIEVQDEGRGQEIEIEGAAVIEWLEEVEEVEEFEEVGSQGTGALRNRKRRGEKRKEVMTQECHNFHVL
jgi:intein/homing endonuclease